MRELVIKSENDGVLSKEDRDSIDVEIQALKDEINRIAESTSFNGKALLNGDYNGVTGSKGKLTFKIGANSNTCDTLGITIGSMKAEDLKVKDIKISSATFSAAALKSLDAAIVSVSSQRAKLGAIQNRMEYAIESLSTTAENLTSAESRIRDVDMASEMVNFTKNNILQQSAMSMLAQANQQPQQILSLLR
jgi:flagellin